MAEKFFTTFKAQVEGPAPDEGAEGGAETAEGGDQPAEKKGLWKRVFG
jgi:hypothetical protein